MPVLISSSDLYFDLLPSFLYDNNVRMLLLLAPGGFVGFYSTLSSRFGNRLLYFFPQIDALQYVLDKSQ